MYIILRSNTICFIHHKILSLWLRCVSDKSFFYQNIKLTCNKITSFIVYNKLFDFIVNVDKIMKLQ